MHVGLFRKTLNFGFVLRTTGWTAFAAATLVFSGCANHKPSEVPAPTASLENPYNRPFISPGAKFAGLPPAVQHTIRAQIGSAEIYDITKIPHGEDMAYRVNFVKSDIYPPLYLGTDGSVLYPDLTVAKAAPPDMFALISGSSVAGISVNDLPAPVLKVIRTKAAASEIDYIDKETRGDQTVYVVAFKDKKNFPRMHITSDGTILKTTAP